MRSTDRRLWSFAVAILLTCGVAGHAANFLVTTTNDGGGGSLRRAIQEANTNLGPDKILFAIPGLGVQTITPLTPLPAITGQVAIDGSSQGSPDHLIVIDGSRLHPDAFGLVLQGQGSRIHHLVLHGFGPTYPSLGAALWLADGGLHQVTDCRLGTDAKGLVEVANHVGIWVNSPGNTIAGNLISASWETGVIVSQADGNLIDRNLLGSNRDGAPFAAPNSTSQLWGVALYGGSHNEVRRNTIGGSNGGIWLYSANDNIIVGNSIGVDRNDTRLGNLVSGIYILGSSSGNVIGGVAPGEGNSFGSLGLSFPPLSGDGQAVVVLSGVGNSIRGNRMFDFNPAVIAIDLGVPGPDANDWGDTDTGANNLQNAPLLHDAWEDPSGPGVRVEGALYTSRSSRFSYAIDVYATTAASVAGACEARRYLGTHLLSASPSGVATFSFLLSVTVDPGAKVSATATAFSLRQPPETSELSPCVSVR